MRVGAQIHGHSVDELREVGSVVKAETTQKVLVRLAVAGVLRCDQTGQEFQQVAGAKHGADNPENNLYLWSTDNARDGRA